MIQGRIFQGAWNLLFFALFGIAVAIKYNWFNSKLGYWLNLVVISAGDIGFAIFLLILGYVPLVPGALGPFFVKKPLNKSRQRRHFVAGCANAAPLLEALCFKPSTGV